MKRHLRINNRGMTLMELMVSVTILGVLATAATASFASQVAKSHSVEAVAVLGEMKQAIQMGEAVGSSAAEGLDFTATAFGGPAGFPLLATPKVTPPGQATGNEAPEPSADSGSTADPAPADEPVTDPGNGNSTAKTGGIDGDGNAGHGNNDGECDPDNPGASGHSVCPGGSSDSDGRSVKDGKLESLCGAASPVPSSMDDVRAKVYSPKSGEWSSGSDSSGWQCLGMSRSGIQRYQYGYDVGAPTLEGSTESYTAWARGDLDGDGRSSMFRLRGELVNGIVIHAPSIEMVDPTE